MVAPSGNSACFEDIPRNGNNDVNHTDNGRVDVPYVKICFLIVTILVYIGDVGSDLTLAYNYLVQDRITYGILTFVFHFIPYCWTSHLCWKMWTQKDPEIDPDIDTIFNISLQLWRYARITSIILQCAPALRLSEVLFVQWYFRSNQQAVDFLRKNTEEKGDVLNLYHCFLESVPQIVLQLSLIMELTSNFDSFHQVIGYEDLSFYRALSVFFSIGSIGLTLVLYAIRAHTTKIGAVLEAFWNILIAGSRIVLFSALASVHPKYTGTYLICRTLLIATLSFMYEFLRTREWWDAFLQSVHSIMQICVFIAKSKRTTRKIYIAIYTLMFVELCAMLYAYWLYYFSEDRPWFYQPVLFFVPCCFLLGIVIQSVYGIWFPAPAEPYSVPSVTASHQNPRVVTHIKVDPVAD